MFKKKGFKSALTIVGIVLVSVIFAGVTARLTDNYTDFSFRKLNEDNLLFGSYDYLAKIEDGGLTFENVNSVIKINGELDDDADDYLFEFAHVELEAGEYTYTCFDNPSIDTYYSYVCYVDDSGKPHFIVADFDSDDEDFEGAVVDGYSTFTLEEKTTVKFIILVRPDQTIRNVKAMPVLVEGDDPGEFYQ